MRGLTFNKVLERWTLVRFFTLNERMANMLSYLVLADMASYIPVSKSAGLWMIQVPGLNVYDFPTLGDMAWALHERALTILALRGENAATDQ